MVCIGDLESDSSETMHLPIPGAIALFESFSDHSSPLSDGSVDSEIYPLRSQECCVDQLSTLLCSEIGLPKAHPLPYEEFEEGFVTSSPLLDLRGSHQYFTGIGDLHDFSNHSASVLEYIPPLHLEMVHSFQNFIQDMGTEQDRESISRVIRYALSVRGVRMLDIRCKLHHWYRGWVNARGAVPVEIEKNFAFELIESEWYEDKLAAVLFIQEVLMAKKKISFKDLPRLEEIFRGGHIKVYRVCDHFSSKILCHLAEQSKREPRECALMLDFLFEWAHAEDSWQARAAMFALAAQANNGISQKRLMSTVQHMLTRPEVETKTMAGAALRSISEVDPDAVVEFLNRTANIANISAGALEKATSKLTKRQRDYFKKLRRELSSTRNEYQFIPNLNASL